MPGEDVSDLREVVDAINRLCDGMKTSYEECESEGLEATPPFQEGPPQLAECKKTEVVTSIQSPSSETPLYVECKEALVNPEEISVHKVETHNSENCFAEESSERSSDASVHEIFGKCSKAAVRVEPSGDEFVPVQKVEWYSSEHWSDISSTQKVESSSEISSVQKIESYIAEKWSDSTSQISLPGQAEDVTSRNEEPASEMYYTASSEVSLLSDLEGPEKLGDEVVDSDKREVVAIAGHVAAMRERFESMTRANTPCPDLVRSVSPTTLDWRNVTPSPDHLG